MELKNKIFNISLLAVTTIAVITAAFTVQSERGLTKEYKEQTQELESVKTARARQYGILMRLPNNADWKKATDTVNKMTDEQVLKEFAKIGQKENN